MPQQKLIIRSYPKIIFFYPTFIVTLAIFIYSVFGGNPATSTCGAIFALMFLFNLMVVAINFTRHIFINILIGLFAFTFLFLYLNTVYPGMLGNIGVMIRNVDIIMNKGFYAFMTFSFALAFLIILIDTRFEYCEVTSNEIIFHAGVFSDVRRFPAPSLRYSQEIVDVFEYMLLRAGNIKMLPQGEREFFVLENVPFIKDKFQRLDDILSKTEVEVVAGKPAAPPEGTQS